MKLSIACLAAAAAFVAAQPAAQAQTWQRSGMKQGYYAAYAGNADGVTVGGVLFTSLKWASTTCASPRCAHAAAARAAERLMR